jgi:hypothetical protein
LGFLWSEKKPSGNPEHGMSHSRVTRWVCEKNDQNVAQLISCQN